MSVDTLERLEVAQEGLISALDGNDIDALELRIEELRHAIAVVRAQGGWRDSQQLKARAQRIAQLGEAARVRVNILTDVTRQRLQMLAGVRGEAIGGAYPRLVRPAA